MRFFIAGLGTETNTFSPFPTTERHFREDVFYESGQATRYPARPFTSPLHDWRARATARGDEVVESICVYGAPDGPTLKRVYEAFRDKILDDLRAALPVDVVLINMHGAMIAEGYADCQADFLARIRELAGQKAVVGVEMDLHCHVTGAVAKEVDCLITYKTYPHLDQTERAAELFRMCADAAEGRTCPVISMFDCRMNGTWPTVAEPMKSFVAEMIARERDAGVISISFAHSFPWGDIADTGARIIVITDGDAELGSRVARELGQRVWSMRDAMATRYLSVDEALDRAMAIPEGPVVIADAADNPGGGAAGDSTFVLRRILDRRIPNAAIVGLIDPTAVALCFSVGEGESFNLRIGGKAGPMSGYPVDLRVRVERLAADYHATFLGLPRPMGDCAWISGDGVDIVLVSNRAQVGHPDLMTGLGLDPMTRHIVVVKSSQHFRAGFDPIAREMLFIGAPGTVSRDFAKIPYRNRTGRFWPKDEDPFAPEGE